MCNERVLLAVLNLYVRIKIRMATFDAAHSIIRTVAPGIYCTQTAQFQPSIFLSRLNISFSYLTSSGGGRHRHTVPADDKRPAGLCPPANYVSMGKTDLQSASCQITA